MIVFECESYEDAYRTFFYMHESEELCYDNARRELSEVAVEQLEETRYRIEYNFEQRCFHFEDERGKHKENTCGWKTLATNVCGKEERIWHWFTHFVYMFGAYTAMNFKNIDDILKCYNEFKETTKELNF